MAQTSSDTAIRSLEHWSERGRREMDDFYAFAALDYRMLASVLDWPAVLRGLPRGGDPPTLLDVACGSGKFPAALLRDTDLTGLDPIAYDLLDPAEFSLAEAARQLEPPFAEGDRYEVTLERLDPAAGPWDMVWATHALYALEPDHLDVAAARFVQAIAPGGLGFVAQGSREGHYLRVYDAFLAGVRGGEGTPYLASEDIAAALARAGAEVANCRLSYEHVADAGQAGRVEGYLQRCVFDDSLSLDELLGAPVVGPYLQGCRDASGGYRFAHQVDCLMVGTHGGEPSWTAGP